MNRVCENCAERPTRAAAECVRPIQSTMSSETAFGEFIRARRLECDLSLRRFAQLVGVSPTYLSQIEQGNLAPPTVERVTQMAVILEEHPDPLIALAGRVPADLPAIIRRRPIEVPELLREVNGLTAGQLRAITAQVRRMKQEGSEQ